MPTESSDGVVREQDGPAEEGGGGSLDRIESELSSITPEEPRRQEGPGVPRPEQWLAPGAPPGVEKMPMGAPLQAFVKGGTHTSASERMYHERFVDAEKRRNQDDADKRLASIPTELGGAKMFSHSFAENPEVPKAYVKLRYANRYGAPCEPGECLADVLIENWEKPNDLTLIFVCPGCYTDHHKSAGDSQLKMRMSNRWWNLRPKYGETRWADPDGKVRIYKLAGDVVESEVFSCPDCGYRGRIVNGWLRQE